MLVAFAFLIGRAGGIQNGSAAKAGAEASQFPVGDWLGDSICVVRPSACNDEKALYRIQKLGDKPNHFSLQAGKIVNGQAVDMGTVDCAYAPEKRALTCEFAKGAVHLNLQDNRMEGTMNLTDGTLWRNITLRHN